MTEKKQKRYPTDRLKLHALLKKKEKELVDLREEVEEISKTMALIKAFISRCAGRRKAGK